MAGFKGSERHSELQHHINSEHLELALDVKGYSVPFRPSDSTGINNGLQHISSVYEES